MGDFIFRSLCKHLSKKYTLPPVADTSPERPPGAEHTQLTWLKQISKMCCEQLLAECQAGTGAHQSTERGTDDVAERCMLRFQQQQHQCNDAVAQAEKAVQQMQAAAHRLTTVTEEVREIYAELTGACTDVVNHENTTAEDVQRVVGALRGGRDELIGTPLRL